MLQCSLQCPGLTRNELHLSLDDPVRLNFSHWALDELVQFSLRQCFNCRLVVAPERDSVVPNLIDQLRCSPLRSRETLLCPAKVGPRYLVFHQHFSWVSGHHLSGSLHSNLDVERTVTPIWGPTEWLASPSILSASHLSDSGLSPDVRRPCLDRQPLLGHNHCLLTTSPAYQQTLLGWNRGSHFPSAHWFGGHVQDLLSPNSRIGVLSLRPCSLCSGVFPSLPTSHLFIRHTANSTNQHNMLASGGTLVPMRCSSAAFSVLA